jgi:hypothetical protein
LPGTGQLRRKGPLVLLPTVGTGFDLGPEVADDLIEDDVVASMPRAALGGEVAEIGATVVAVGGG